MSLFPLRPSRLLLSVLLILSFVNGVYALSPTEVSAISRQFRRVDTSGNLSGDYVRSVARDERGVIWLLMMTHVERYDGHRFHHYEVGGMPQGGDALHDLALTADGRLWITGSEHNYIYHEREDCIVRAEAEDFAPYGIDEPVSRLFVDSRQDLWCSSATDRGELLHYNFATRRLLRMDVSDAGTVIGLSLAHDKPYLLTDTPDGRCAIWTTVQGGPTLTSVAVLPIIPSQRTRCYTDSQGRLWIYVLDEPCLWQYDIRTSACTDASILFPVDGIMMTALIDDGDGNLWIGTGNHGICMLDTKGRCTLLQQDEGAPFQLADNHINCFYRDSETSTMWVGTSKQGLVYCNQSLTSISIAHMPGSEDVSCLDSDPDGCLWMGFDSQGAAACPSPRQFFAQPVSPLLRRLTTASGGLSSNQVVCTLRDSQGYRWWGSYGGELLAIAPDGAAHRLHDSRFHHVISLQEDDKGLLWVGTFYDGVFALDRASDTITHAITTYDGALRSGCINQLVWDPVRHGLFIATNDGLYTLDVATDRLQCTMAGTNIRAILLTADGRTLWVGLDTGLMACDAASGDTLAFLTTHEGLSHNTIFALVEDDYGAVWASTKHGISHITASPQGYRCASFGNADGIGSVCFNPHAATRLADGTILMGALGGVVAIHPRPGVAVSALPHPKTFFTALFLGNEQVLVNQPLQDKRVILRQNLLTTDHIDLRHSDSAISIEVSDMNCLLPQQRFQYRLGREGTWHDLEGHTVVLNDLRPGSYLVQARVNGSVGVPASAATDATDDDVDGVASLTVRIAPPWYLSTTALILYGLSAAAILLLLVLSARRRATQRIAKQQRDMAIEQQLRMDEAKMRFFTNVSHDMRTPLTLIVTPLNRLLQRDDLDDEVLSQLQLISHSTDTLQEEITQLLDYRRLDQTPGTLTLSDGSLRDFVQSVCQPFLDADLQGGVTLHVNLPADDALMTRFDRAKVKRIITNLISNAIKYNKPGGLVVIDLHRDGGDAVISVSDQGIGIRPENRERIFERFFQESHDEDTYTGSGIGLHLVKQYVTMLGGTVAVSAVQPEGSIFTVRLPLRGVADEVMPPTPRPSQPLAVADAVNDDANLPTDEVEGEATTAQEPVSANVPLLIVEDNDDFRTFLQSCLTEHYRVVTAPNGREALRVLERQDVRLIISDVMMPVMDGMALCRRVKTDLRYSHIPFIMLSARTADQQQAEGLGEGADDYLTKPFNLDILLLRISRLLHWAEGANERFQQPDIKPTELTASRIDQRLITQAIEQVQAHIADPNYSVEQLCSALAMSRSNLYKKLIAITGQSPLQFIRTLRIKLGRQLLEETDEPISQVAYRVGLSPKQFAHYFRDAYGILPSDFRRQ